jgi:hypothetical protein
LWGLNEKSRLQEEIAGSKEKPPPHPDFEEYTYNSLIGGLFEN